MFILPAVICELSNLCRKQKGREAAERQQRQEQPGAYAGPVVGRISLRPEYRLRFLQRGGHAGGGVGGEFG